MLFILNTPTLPHYKQLSIFFLKFTNLLPIYYTKQKAKTPLFCINFIQKNIENPSFVYDKNGKKLQAFYRKICMYLFYCFGYVFLNVANTDIQFFCNFDVF